MKANESNGPVPSGRTAPFDFDRYTRAELEQRSGVKWHRDGRTAIGAWVADMDFPVAEEIKAAIQALVDTDDLGYPDPSLQKAVQAAFADRWRARYGLKLEPECVIVISDVVQAVYLCLLSYTKPGDGVAILTPAYPPFFSAVADTQRRAVLCDLIPGPARFEVDLPQLRRAVREREARVLLLCNPHNPTGRSFQRSELQGIAEIAEENNLIVISDEIHADLTLTGASHTAYGSLADEVMARTVTLSSASKAFNLAGLRCAVAGFGSEELRDIFQEFPAHARGSVSVLGMTAALAAWEKGDRWLDGVVGVLSSNRDFVVTQLHEHGSKVGIRPPEATYLAWLDMRAHGLGDDPSLWVREHAEVALSPGPEYGLAGAGHVRLNFATSRPVLEEMLGRITSALRSCA